MKFLVRRFGFRDSFFNRGGIWFEVIYNKIIRQKLYEELHFNKGQYHYAILEVKNPYFIGTFNNDEYLFPFFLYYTIFSDCKNEMKKADLFKNYVYEKCILLYSLESSRKIKNTCFGKDKEYSLFCQEQEISRFEQKSAKKLKSEGYDAVFFFYQ